MKRLLSLLIIASLLIPVSSAINILDIFNSHTPVPLPLPDKESRWTLLSASLNSANTPSNISKLQHLLVEYNYKHTDVFAITVTDLDKTFLLSYTGLGITSAVEVTQQLSLTESQVINIINILAEDTDTTSISFWTKLKLWYVLR